ncbi:uncharacterized protein PHACADRAFT_264649 [Phanerochaete carnosa HHB-10118-sp]|uniref:Uncharacterized protein n=1 Tax=Phanerochaete carnosa (strain HHB-10118-sp) TaxID=650164 RepID=K5UKF6_PHACS|nr:uncharacterized protein PHACADRAFT_264649 [Phanerochaete carnosa HHB-10118-sp]EKM50106.1 hypothetical protein PHACADRAFT_264649 [Phanerochaete carnosa HHB-10118-sp]
MNRVPLNTAAPSQLLKSCRENGDSRRDIPLDLVAVRIDPYCHLSVCRSDFLI